MADIREYPITVDILQTGRHPVVGYSANETVFYKLDRQGTGCTAESFVRHFNRMGVYFYVGHPDDGSPVEVYIGEGGSISNRKRTHVRDEWQDWDELMFVYHPRMTVGIRKAVESRCITLARKQKGIRLINTKLPQEELTESESKTCKLIMDVLPWLMYVAGYGFLLDRASLRDASTIESLPTDVRFTYCCKGRTAYGHFDPEGFVIEKDSTIAPRTEHLKGSDLRLYEELEAKGVIVDGRFTLDQKFDGPDRAARFVTGTTGGSLTGRWKDEKGRSIKIYLDRLESDR